MLWATGEALLDWLGRIAYAHGVVTVIFHHVKRSVVDFSPGKGTVLTSAGGNDDFRLLPPKPAGGRTASKSKSSKSSNVIVLFRL